jgi:hypothetical protein
MEITERVEVRLEHEAQYDWVVFVPQCEIDVGTVTNDFGKVADENDFKYVVSKLGSAQPHWSSRMSSRTVSNGSTGLGHRRQYSTVSRTQSSASTLEQCRSNSSSNGIVSLNRWRGTRRTRRTWQH